MQEEIKKAHGFRGIEVASEKDGRLPGLIPPPWIHEGPIYEIFVRTFSKEGTLQQVTEKIPYLKELGIKTIWLMPIHPIGEKGRKGSWGSPYAIKDHYVINDRLGTKTDLKNLVQGAHNQNMRIILDLVPNHGANDHILLDKDPGLFDRDDRGNFLRKEREWSDIIDLDYHNPETVKYMMDIMTYWIKEFDIDGYRCDVAGMVPLSFWQIAREELIKLKPDLFLLAEWESARLHNNAFHACYDWTLYLLMTEIVKNKRPAGDAPKWVQQQQQLFPENALPMRFSENHDFPRTRKAFSDSGFFPFVAFNFSMHGLPLIYAGQEIGLTSAPSLFEKDTLDWKKKDDKIFNFYKKLIHLRKKFPALAAREMQVLKNDHPQEVLSYLKIGQDGNILLLLNFCDKELQVRIDDLPNVSNTSFADLFNEKREYSGQDLRCVELDAYEVLFLKEMGV